MKIFNNSIFYFLDMHTDFVVSVFVLPNCSYV